MRVFDTKTQSHTGQPLSIKDIGIKSPAGGPHHRFHFQSFSSLPCPENGGMIRGNVEGLEGITLGECHFSPEFFRGSLEGLDNFVRFDLELPIFGAPDLYSHLCLVGDNVSESATGKHAKIRGGFLVESSRTDTRYCA